MEYSRITDDIDLLYWKIGECAWNTHHLVSRSSRSSNTANTHADQKFTGHFLESEGNLGLYHAQARLYDPVVGRFWGVDGILQLKTPIELIEYDGAKHLSLSPYVYVRNNPIIYYDPDGLTDWSAIGKGFIQIVSGVGGAVGGAKLTIGSAALTATGAGAPLGVAGMLAGHTITAISLANIGTGISNISKGFKADDGESIVTSENAVTTVALGLGANGTQAATAEGAFTIVSGGGLFKIGKKIADDKIIQATQQAIYITNDVRTVSENYEEEYLDSTNNEQ